VNIYINGEIKSIADGLDLKALLDQFEINPRSVVVEKNEVVIPHDDVITTSLMEGDKIEVVRFVGGGAGETGGAAAKGLGSFKL